MHKALLSLLLLWAQQDGVIRVNTRLVQVDVVVRNKNGPVPNLTKDDFVILDNDKPQRIDVFSVTAARAPEPPKRVTAPLPAGIVTNRLGTSDGRPATATVILFDRLNTPLQSQNYATRQLIDYIRSMNKEDRVALYAFDGGLHVAHDFTNDPEKLIRAATNIKFGDLAAADVRTPSELFEQLGTDPDGLISGDFANAMAFDFTARRVEATAWALESIARHLSGLPGRKTLVWLSGGFPLTVQPLTNLRVKENEIDFYSQIRRATRALNDSNIAIYPVDIRGLIAPEPIRTTTARGAPLAPNPPPDSMILLAGATGGRAFYRTNDLASAIKTAVDDGEVSYTLGFYPAENSAAGKFHKLSVKVAAKGVEVHHRSGYYELIDRQLTAKERETILGELLGSPLNASQVGLAATAEPESIPGSYHVKLSINVADVHMEHLKDHWIGILNLAIRLDSAKSKNVKISTIPLNLSDDQFRSAMKGSLVAEQSVPGALPGDRLKIVVQDPATGAAGSLSLQLKKD